MYLEPFRTRLIRDDEGLLVDIDGVSQRVARVAKAFPVTRPNLYVGLMNLDGREIGIIKDPHLLDRESRELLEAQLKIVYFIPSILEIFSVEPSGTGSRWAVQTDDGDHRFRINDREALDGSESPRILITDEHGRRRQIQDYWQLDRDSRNAIRDLLPDKVLRMRYGDRQHGGRGRGGGRGGGMGGFSGGGGGFGFR